jgi:hypothetical protein
MLYITEKQIVTTDKNERFVPLILLPLIFFNLAIQFLMNFQPLNNYF